VSWGTNDAAIESTGQKHFRSAKMTRARGQPSRTLLNREYPHQVVVLAETVGGKTLDQVIAFHDRARVPIKSRSARRNDKWHLLYCFAERRHAVAFQLMFGGELLDRPPPR
jgi:hypothetical protein